MSCAVNWENLTEQEEITYLRLLEQEDLEEVSPKLEAFREPSRIKGCRGGRGAGAKSWSIASLLIQRAHHEQIKIACLREIQQSLEESVYSLMVQTIDRLRYKGWRVTKEYLESPAGAHIIFRGLRDLRAANQIKGLESYDIFWLEEADTIINESLSIIMPTLRKPGSELWFSYNPNEEVDPIAERFWNTNRDDAILVDLKPGREDNPWWTDELQKEMEEDFLLDPDEAEHIWYGQPRIQGDKAVMSRTAVRGAVNRNIEAVGQMQVGIDVARFGDDKTKFYKRKGMKIIDRKTLAKADTRTIVYEAWYFIGRDPTIPVKVDDTGVGGGVTDGLREIGAKVVAVNFGGSPKDKNKYTSVADELWFEFDVNAADIPDDKQLVKELTGRHYSYDKQGRRKVESKDDYKKRLGNSPDDADALLLCYYQGGSIKMSSKTAAALRARRRR